MDLDSDYLCASVFAEVPETWIDMCGGIVTVTFGK